MVWAGRIDAAHVRSVKSTVDCPEEAAAPEISCFTLEVPLDIANPDQGQPVVLFGAFVNNGDPNQVGPVAFLQGGPGVGAVQYAKGFVGIAHDVYLIDQRGTGFSEPKLDCPEIDGLWVARYHDDPQVRADDATVLDAYRRCGQRLGENSQLDHFNTTAAAADLELARRLLVGDRWSLWGSSYGTRLALTVMRDHPAGVRAAVLDSVVPFEVDFFATIAAHAIDAIEALDRACDRDACSSEHGDFLTELSELTVELDRVPAVVTATRPESGDQFLYRIDGAEMLDLVFGQLYSTSQLRSLPRQVARADSGGFEELVYARMQRADPERRDLAYGAYYAAWCREEMPFHDPAVARAGVAEGVERFGASFYEAFNSEELDEVCDAFGVAAAPKLDNEPVDSAIPTLVFAGALDPITPPSWSRQVAETLANATYVEMSDHGHGMTTPCPGTIHIDFLIDPDRAVDISCAADAGGPDFD